MGSRISDVFGKAGFEVLEGLMEGKSVDDILKTTKNKWLAKRSDEIKAVAKGVLSQSDIFILKECVDIVRVIDEKILKVEIQCEMLVNERDVEIVSSVPGVGRRSAAAITAEIGDARRFVADGKKIACAAGLVPFVFMKVRFMACMFFCLHM